MSEGKSIFWSIFEPLIIMLLLVLGAYVVQLAMGAGNLVMYVASYATHRTITNITPVNIFVITFYVLIAFAFVYEIIKLVTAIRSRAPW